MDTMTSKLTVRDKVEQLLDDASYIYKVRFIQLIFKYEVISQIV